MKFLNLWKLFLISIIYETSYFIKIKYAFSTQKYHTQNAAEFFLDAKNTISLFNSSRIMINYFCRQHYLSIRRYRKKNYLLVRGAYSNFMIFLIYLYIRMRRKKNSIIPEISPIMLYFTVIFSA